MKTDVTRITRLFDLGLSRRCMVKGLGRLTLGSLGFAGISHANAKKNCEQDCRDDNCGTLSPRKCANRCRQRCRGKN